MRKNEICCYFVAELSKAANFAACLNYLTKSDKYLWKEITRKTTRDCLSQRLKAGKEHTFSM